MCTKKMSKDDLEKWDEIYQYVKKHILKLDDWQNIDSHTVMRIKGLKDGQFVSNPNIIPKAFYTWEELLLAFKYSKIDIMVAFNNVETKDIKHKTNIMLKIVEKNLNVVVDKLKQKKKTDDKIENIEINEGSKIKYKKKSKDIKNKRLKELL